MTTRNFKNEDVNIEMVEDTTFSKMLIHCIGTTQERIQEESMRVTGNIENMMKFLTNEEKYLDELYWLYRPILNCLKSIETSIFFISNYNKKDYLRKKFVIRGRA